MKLVPSAIFLALASAFAVKVNDYLDPKVDSGLAVFLAALGGVGVSLLAEWLFIRLPMQWRWARHLIDPRSRLEGHWLIHAPGHSDRPFAFATFEYNSHSDAYSYHGLAFTPSAQPQATWRSHQVYIDLGQGQVRWFGEGTIFGQQVEATRNFGTIEFERSRRGQFARGQAFFVDFGVGLLKHHYFLDRVDSLEDFAKAAEELATNDQIIELIKLYIESRGAQTPILAGDSGSHRNLDEAD